jgi:hypothetical protein
MPAIITVLRDAIQSVKSGENCGIRFFFDGMKN